MNRADRLIRVDFHSHTSLSPDASVPPAELVERAVAAGLDRIAITDHNLIDGALEAHSRYPDRVIVGEEITCRGGTHVIGLFLSSRIPKGLPVEETVARIRDQDGIVYAPHPYAYAVRSRRHAARALAEAEVVEVFNSRAFLPHWNRRAALAARRRALPMAAGTDAHFSWELGRAYTEMSAFRSVESFRQALATARPVGVQTASPWVHVASQLLHKARWATGRCPQPSAAEPHWEGAASLSR